MRCEELRGKLVRITYGCFFNKYGVVVGVEPGLDWVRVALHYPHVGSYAVVATRQVEEVAS